MIDNGEDVVSFQLRCPPSSPLNITFVYLIMILLAPFTHLNTANLAIHDSRLFSRVNPITRSLLSRRSAYSLYSRTTASDPTTGWTPDRSITPPTRRERAALSALLAAAQNARNLEIQALVHPINWLTPTPPSNASTAPLPFVSYNGMLKD